MGRFVKSGEWNHEVFATWVALGILFLYWCLGSIVARVKRLFARKRRGSIVRSCVNIRTEKSLEKLIKESDLQKLVEELDEVAPDGNWSVVLDKSNDTVSYFAKRREPKDGGATEYLSTTLFRNCTVDLLRDFYMDNDYRLHWDSTVLKHQQLEICLQSGIEVGRIVKKFPLMMAREYVLAWRVWMAGENTFFCIIKACEHPDAPTKNEFKRVKEYLSGWRIQPVLGSNACEVKMLHRENAGVGKDMARIAFSRGIWSYVNKMDQNLRKYNNSSLRKARETNPDAVTLCSKISSELEQKLCLSHGQSSNSDTKHQSHRNECKRPIGFVVQGIFLLGWAVFLGHRSSSIGAKIAAAVFMNKAVRRKHRSENHRSENHPSENNRQTSRYVSKSFSIHR